MSGELKPGIYPNVSFSDYLRWPILSQSTLKEGRASMAHLKAALDGDRVKEPTDAMQRGSALHVACLEPEQMADRVVCWTGKARRGKEWDEFQDEHAGKIILTQGYYDSMCGMVESLRRHPVMRDWQAKMQGTEVAAIGEVYGTLMKGRCDALTADPLIDLKATRSTDERAIRNTVMTFGYHIQAAIYRRLFNRDRFVLLMVEDQPPYDVCAFELSEAAIAAGDEEAMTLIQRYQFCQKQGVWPGRSDEIIQLDLPDWAASDEAEAITIDGLPAFS